jgi:hypothetical protein
MRMLDLVAEILRWRGLAFVFVLFVAACTGGSVGNSDCAPATPYSDWPADDGQDGGLVEIQATPTGTLEVWGLIWTTPPIPVGFETKMVWKVIGEGDDFGITAFNGTEQTDITWGVVKHQESSWDREGDEYGVAFVFPTAGCWDIQIARGVETVHTYIEVVDSE